MHKEDNSTVVMFDTENSIILGDYLDLLLNRTMDLEESYGGEPENGVYIQCSHEKPIQGTISKLVQYEHILYADSNKKISRTQAGHPIFIYSGGIRIPHYEGTKKMDEGSGNIVISGKPGVGKSTLAFQFAAACASRLNEGIAVYFSLDVDEKQIVKSMRHPGGQLKINFLCDYPSAKNEDMLPYDSNSNEELEQMFRKVLYKDNDEKIIPQLLLPKLSPRGISPDANVKEDVIFLQRIEELQKLLRAIYSYNTRQREKDYADREPLVKLVAIDSLDVFGERTLTREEINRLFMLFKQYGIIGVFTMGNAGYESLTSEAVYKAAVTYQADVVIELKREFYNNYTCSYFEIAKSRYIRHVLGHHPYKVETYKKLPENMRADACDSDEFIFQNTDLIKKIVVLPSLHYRISASENSVFPVSQEIPNRDKVEKWKKTIFGIPQIVDIMPNHFKDRNMDFPQIITVSGSSGLFKSDIALNALLSGIVDSGENGLIVRLGDRDAFTVRGVRFEKALLNRTIKYTGQNGQEEGQAPARIYFYEKSKDVVHNDEPNKYTLKGWTITKAEAHPQLLEVTFKNGALLPEEFVDEICKIINIYKIRRVVFVDLKYIGSSYPFLVNSDTSGDLFLSAFVHIMRNYGTHVIMSSSESGLAVSDVELSKAGILADAILSCTAKIEDGRYESVYVTGEGLITNEQRNRAELKIDYGNEYELLFCDDSDHRNYEIHSAVKLCPFHIDLKPVETKINHRKESEPSQNDGSDYRK